MKINFGTVVMCIFLFSIIGLAVILVADYLVKSLPPEIWMDGMSVLSIFACTFGIPFVVVLILIKFHIFGKPCNRR